ncbi:MAG: DUF2007 domain-containing protein [Caldilineales bacterium]
MTASALDWLNRRRRADSQRAQAAAGSSIQPGEPVMVYEAAGDLEAQVIKAYLQDAGIPVMLQGEALGRVYGLTVGKIARVRVYVPAPLAEKARELLERDETDDESDGGMNAESTDYDLL